MNQWSSGTSNTLLISGIFLIGFGLVALFSPVAAGDLVVKVAAVLLLATGLFRLFQAFRSQGKLETMLFAILGAVIAGLGILVWLNPGQESGFLTMLLAIFFLANGIWKFSAAFHYRRYRAWGWLLLSGLVSLTFAWLMWRQSPLSGVWAVGVLIGLDLVFTGFVSILLALSIKRARKARSFETISL